MPGGDRAERGEHADDEDELMRLDVEPAHGGNLPAASAPEPAPSCDAVTLLRGLGVDRAQAAGEAGEQLVREARRPRR